MTAEPLSIRGNRSSLQGYAHEGIHAEEVAMRGHIRIVWLVAMLAVMTAACSSNNPPTESSTSSPPAGIATSPPPTSEASSPPPAGTDLSGTWKGTYSGSFNGTFTLNWTQSGDKLTGTIDLSTAGTSPINGTVTGSSIQFGTVGSQAITYTGTVNGDSMSGSYKVGGAAGGSWNASKSG
jgi:hypothetical protein